MDTELSTKAVALCDKRGHPTDHELRTLAQEFDAAVRGWTSTPQTVDVRGMMRAWARLRRAWCNHTGEPLL